MSLDRVPHASISASRRENAQRQASGLGRRGASSAAGVGRGSEVGTDPGFRACARPRMLKVEYARKPLLRARRGEKGGCVVFGCSAPPASVAPACMAPQNVKSAGLSFFNTSAAAGHCPLASKKNSVIFCPCPHCSVFVPPSDPASGCAMCRSAPSGDLSGLR